MPKFNRTAVERNRLKRRLRELTRLNLLRALPAVDVVIRARRETYDAPFATLTQEIDRVRSGIARASVE